MVLIEDAAGNMTRGIVETDLELFDTKCFQGDKDTIHLALLTFDESRLHVVGGEIGFMDTSVPSLEAMGESEVNISDGEFADGVLAIEQAIVTKTGGNVMDDFVAEGVALVFPRGYSYVAIPTWRCSGKRMTHLRRCGRHGHWRYRERGC